MVSKTLFYLPSLVELCATNIPHLIYLISLMSPDNVWWIVRILLQNLLFYGALVD